jgi:phytoene/squalene synthetase
MLLQSRFPVALPLPVLIDRTTRMMREMEVMAADPLDDYIDAVSTALGLPVVDIWKPAVKTNLEVSLRLARLVDEFVLPDETEPASVFTA